MPFSLNAVEILVLIGGFTVWPIAPAIIAGWACGWKMRGISISGGLALGVIFGVAVAFLQLKALAWDIGVDVQNWMYLLTPATSIILTVAACGLTAMIARKLGRA